MTRSPSEDLRDATFRALAHPARRQVIDYLFQNPGATVGAVAAQFDSTRIAVMKHLRVLEEARLVLSQKRGRSRLLYFNPVPLHEISDHWRTRYASVWSTRLLDFKSRVEGAADDSAEKAASPRHPDRPANRPRSPNRPDPADSLPEEPP